MTEISPPSDTAPGHWLWQCYLSRYKGALALATLLMAIEGSMLGLLSWIMRPMFDQFTGAEPPALWGIGLVVLAVFVTRALASVGQKVLIVRLQETVAARLRGDLLRHLMGLDSTFHQSHPPGHLIERVQGDVSAINQVWSTVVTGLGRDLVAVIWLFGVALWVDWRWTMVALLGIPVLVLPSLLVQGAVRRAAARARDIASRMATRLDEVFHGVEQIKLNRLEGYQSDRFRTLTDQRIEAETRAALGQATIPGLIDIMTGIGFLGVLLYGGGQIVAGDKTVGEFMAFFTAMALAFEPLRRLGNLSGQWQIAAASVARIQELFGRKSALERPSRPAPAPKGAPEISFENVQLSYGEVPVLRGASFTAKAGEVTALVGASGAGKSTIFKVLTRLALPSEGRVLVDGQALEDFSAETMRDLCSVVSQDTALFDESLRENILLGRGDVSDAQLDKVLEAAHLSAFLPSLPDGLDSPAGPRGSSLSGGQRQRVAIARALLRDTPVLLLDEATSALDTRSEAIVQDALEQLSEGRTTLVIAHRLSTIRDADRIVVMDQGRVVDEGPHDALLARGGIYADLYHLQFREEADHD